MTPLFALLAGSRPERLAQRCLLHALRQSSEPALRTALLAAAGRSSPSASAPEVLEERPTDSGWRADLVLTWANTPPLRLELKLGAFPTRAQLAAEIDLVVTPSASLERTRAWSGDAAVITWRELAGWITDPTVRRLLEEADAWYSGTSELLDGATADAELRACLAGEGTWSGLYGFLNAVDRHLTTGAAELTYLPSAQFSRAPASGWYGYSFMLARTAAPGSPRGWIGFQRRADRPQLLHWYADEREETPARSFPGEGGVLQACDVADVLLSAARAS